MREYPLSKRLVRKYKLGLIVMTISILILLVVWLAEPTPNTGWGAILLKMIPIVLYGWQIIYFVVSIREPGIKIGKEEIEVKIDMGFNFWKTPLTNLSRIEAKTERNDNVVGHIWHEYVYFKQPVIKPFSVFGLTVWKTSREGFRLDVFDKSVQEEIRLLLS